MGLEQVERDRFRIVRLEQLVPFGKKPLLVLEESGPFLFRLLPMPGSLLYQPTD